MQIIKIPKASNLFIIILSASFLSLGVLITAMTANKICLSGKVEMKEQLIINKEKVEYLSVGREILVQSGEIRTFGKLKCKNKFSNFEIIRKIGELPKTKFEIQVFKLLNTIKQTNEESEVLNGATI